MSDQDQSASVGHALVGELAVTIDRLRPKPGDILVVRVVSPRQGHDLIQALHGEASVLNWEFKIPVLVLPRGAEVTVETVERLREEMEEKDGA